MKAEVEVEPRVPQVQAPLQLPVLESPPSQDEVLLLPSAGPHRMNSIQKREA